MLTLRVAQPTETDIRRAGADGIASDDRLKIFDRAFNVIETASSAAAECTRGAPLVLEGQRAVGTRPRVFKLPGLEQQFTGRDDY